MSLTVMRLIQPTNVIPRILHRIWLGGKPLSEQARMFESHFRGHNPGWDFRLWDEAELERADIPNRLIECTSLSSLSNVLRVEIVRRFGGVYVDCDVDCLRPLGPLLQDQAFVGIEGIFTGNAIFGAVPNHPWLISMSKDWDSVTYKQPPWGPGHMDRHAKNWPVTFYPQRFFYPWLWNDKHDPSKWVPHVDSYMAHYWNMSWSPKSE